MTTTTPTLAPGTKVHVTTPAGADLLTTKWWPKGEVTGTVQKLYKNGNAAVAIDQIRNFSADGLHTINLPTSWLAAR